MGRLLVRERQISLHRLPPPDAETKPRSSLPPYSSTAAWAEEPPPCTGSGDEGLRMVSDRSVPPKTGAEGSVQ